MSAGGGIELVVDGLTVQARRGQTLLELIREQALGDVPTLCYWPGLTPWAGCGLCAVQVGGTPGTVPACDTLVGQGMVVTTRGEEVERARRTALALLLEDHGVACRHPGGAPPGAEPCELCAMAERMGLDTGAVRLARRSIPDDSHPLLWHDPDRCVLCGRCVRACAAAHGAAVLALVGRGVSARIAPALGRDLASSGCEGCGTCAEVCPTGALRVRLPRVPRSLPPGPWIRSSCALCGLACPVEQRVHEDGVVLVRADRGAGASGAGLCRRGRFGPGLLLGAPVLREPLVLEGDAQGPVGWVEAVDRAATLLYACAQRHGEDAVILVASASLTLEASVLCGYLAGEGLGTTQVGSLRVRGGPGLGGAALWCSHPGAVAAVPSADLLLLVGADPERNQPLLAARIGAAQRAGAEVVVIHSDPTDLAARASLWLDPRRGTLGVLLAALLGRLEPAEVRAGRALGLADAARACGLQEGALLDLAARLERSRRPVVLYDLDDALQHGGGDLVSLQRLLHHLGGHEAGLVLLRDEAGACGAALAGLDADLPAILRSGRVRGALVVGADPLLDSETAPLLRDLDALVVLDATPTATTRAAHVVLPVPRLMEREGTFLALDGHLRPLRPLHAHAAGRGMFDVLADLAEALGASPPPRTAADLRAWIAADYGIPADVLERARAAGGPWPVSWTASVPPWGAPAETTFAHPTPRPPAPLARLVDTGLALLERRKNQ
ncbi:MAG: molybdopterin-dependent oxidoreductase [Pseudomonadota bacterium]